MTYRVSQIEKNSRQPRDCRDCPNKHDKCKIGCQKYRRFKGNKIRQRFESLERYWADYLRVHPHKSAVIISLISAVLGEVIIYLIYLAIY